MSSYSIKEYENSALSPLPDFYCQYRSSIEIVLDFVIFVLNCITQFFVLWTSGLYYSMTFKLNRYKNRTEIPNVSAFARIIANRFYCHFS